jgi:DNA-directed RNA polymerase specialized sigma24 family protein
MESRPSDETLLLVADAIGDTFVAVWQKPRGFRGDGDIAAWLWGIAIRRLVSRLRTRAISGGQRRPYLLLRGELPDSQPAEEVAS